MSDEIEYFDLDDLGEWREDVHEERGPEPGRETEKEFLTRMKRAYLVAECGGVEGALIEIDQRSSVRAGLVRASAASCW